MIDATHIVIDLETLGKGPRAVIATMGIVVVERLEITAELYLRVDLEDLQQQGLECDASTAVFWLRQSDAARQEITTREGRLPLDVALGHVIELVDKYSRPFIWASSPSFDCVILRNAFDYCAFFTPWEYWHERDIRTLVALYPALKELPFEGIKHHALHDARHEARQVIEGLRLLAQGATE
jgi:exodeoxyribonuclease VIII